MVTVFVVAILLAIAVPSFKHAIDSTSLSEAANTLVGDLKYARTEAASRGVDVTVAASAGGWGSGWHVVAAPATSAGTATTLRARDALRKTIKIQVKVASGSKASVVYRAQGSLDTSVNTTPCFELSPMHNDHVQPVYVQLQNSGLLRRFDGRAGVTVTCGS